MKYLICHYSEIGLKGKNRIFFEKKLVQNIKVALPKESFYSVDRFRGIIVVDLKNEKGIKERVKKVAGLAYFAFAEKADSDLSEIKETVVKMLKGKDVDSFRVTTKRADKSFPYKSPQVSSEIGAEIVRNFGWSVDLENYDLNCFIEITEKGTFLYLKKIKGYGGLPVGSSGKGSLLLSGGIDSPVAGFKMMKRGLSLDFIHFHAYPLVSDDSIKKVKKLFKILKDYCPGSSLFLMPFGEIQKKIRLEVPEKLRIIFYRRVMLEISQELSKSQNAEVLITGESLGQVSSQTLANMKATEQAVDFPILRPLVGENKEEIIETAKKIGTYNISILPDQDCCTLFNPRKPETNADMREVLKMDKKVKLEKLKRECLKNRKVST